MICLVALPFDNVDQDFLKQPHTWEANPLRFMVWMGPISSVFDILNFIFSTLSLFLW